MDRVEKSLYKKLIKILARLRIIAENNHSPRWIIFLLDLFFTVLSIFIAWYLRFDVNAPTFGNEVFNLTFISILSTRLIFFLGFRIYAHVIRHTSIDDIKRLFFTLGSGTLILASHSVIGRQFEGIKVIPFSVVFIEFLITFYLMVNLRILTKYAYYAISSMSGNTVRTLIIGSKDLAVIAKEAIEINQLDNYKVLAFVDETNVKKKRLAGLPVYHFDELRYIIKSFNIDCVILAKKDLSAEEKEITLKASKQYKLKTLSAPDIWLSGNLSSSAKEVEMEELLNREPIQLNKNHLKEALDGKTVLITGAAGSIGSEIVRQIAHNSPDKIVILDQAETPLYDIELELKERLQFENYKVYLADILNKKRIEGIFTKEKPNIVYHAAAYKHVPMMEINPIEAFQNNVLGSRQLADISHKTGVEKFIMISTDKAVNPTGIMGATKRIAELYIQSLNDNSNTNYITTRFGNVLNSNGSVIPRFLKQLREGGPITVTHPDITRFFMTIQEACQLVIEASVMGNGGEIYLFDMGKAVKILDLAKNLIKSTGYVLGRDIDIKFTGLRPGEKLYEELLLEAEANKPTHHPKIMIAQVCKNNYEAIKKNLDQFEESLNKQDIMEMVRLMKEMVPSFISNNSVFTELDKTK